MFPKPLFGPGFFAAQLFPPSQAPSISKYIDIIAALETLLSTVLPTTTTILPQPYPLMSGPMCFVVPGTQDLIKPQTIGAGRYFTGIEGNFTIKIVDQSFRDIAYSNLSKLTDQTYGIIRTTHNAMRAVNFKIPLDHIGLPITTEPFVITSIESRKEYSGGAVWAVNEFNVRARYAPFFVPSKLADNSTTLAIPTNLADLLLAVQTLIQNLNIFSSQNVLLSLYEEPFPIGGSQFCTISPAPAITFDPDAYGAEHYFTTIDSGIIINFIIRNVLDTSGRADSLLLTQDPSLGLIALVATIINGIQLAFPVNPSGAPLTEEPIWIERIGAPRRFAESGSFATIQTNWRARWQGDFPNPI